MADFKEFTATSALNQDDYINKLYDKRQQSQQQLAQQNQKDSESFLSGQSHALSGQTDNYKQRTQVESQQAAQQPTYAPKNLSAGAAAQVGLSRGNQLQKDVSALDARQAQAQTEIDRQRQQLAQFYQTEIQRATAENDMQRAQQLYDAAKAEEKRLQSLRQEAAVYAQSRGDSSIMDSMVRGDPVQRDTTTPTMQEVLKNEEAINKIYDANAQAQQLKLQQQRDSQLSDLEAKQLAQQRATDTALTDAYTAALQKSRNAAEAQAAYGMGSGTAAQAALARELGLQQDLTDLRTLQLGKDASAGMDAYDVTSAYRKALESANSENELKRAQSLYGAAENEENNLIDQQKWLAQQPSAASGSYGAGSSSKKRTADAGTKTAAKSSVGTTDGVLQGTLQLGKGPISPANLADMVAKGEVSVKQNKISNGPYVENTKPFVSAATSGGTIFANPSKKKTTKRTASGGSKR